MLGDNFAYRGLIEHFEKISAIPRASYHEEKIADYLCAFAEERGLEYYRDGVNNVLINVPADKGFEERPALLLQGHTDMVCEKNEGVEHDFDRCGLELYEDNGWIRARGTTLGADDGVAVATMLYILDGGVSGHGALQCLFTASEEVGLDGAKAFDYSRIYARHMINMDSADESLIIAGCAGGQRSSITLSTEAQSRRAPYVAKLCLRGLAGGHSGEDIDKGRANANKLMGRVLDAVMKNTSLNADIIRISGGTKDNAIPRECEAELAVDSISALRELTDRLSEEIFEGLCGEDAAASLEVTLLNENADAYTVDRHCAEAVTFLMHCVGNGVFDMNHGVEGLVEWSRNLGIVSCDSEGAELVFSSRSSFESRIDASAAELDAYACAVGAEIRHYNRYPGWSFARSSSIRQRYVDAYREVTGETPRLTVIHAGLECGFIGQAVPDMDIISCGPVILDLHSPDERLNKASFERFFSVIKHVVEQ